MTKIILSTDKPELALRFRDYIRREYQRDLPLYQQQGYYLLALEENDPQLSQLLNEAEQYRHTPFAEKYMQASWQDGQTYSLKGRFQSLLPNFSQWRSGWNSVVTAPVTALIGLICVLAYLLSLSDYQTDLYLSAHFPENSRQYSEIWRFFTHALVHLSLSHIVFNLTYWLVFGAMIERSCGSGKVLQLFLAAALISGITQNVFSGPAFFGLSGVVFAILGYVYVMSRVDPLCRFSLPSGFIYLLLAGVAVGFVGPLLNLQVGNAAHISGLLLGSAIAWLDGKRVARKKQN
ncbi:rhomboid family intramembrane serine protease [Testudinibacter sp. TR-2022]|uniref:rhomboid family intramembrane serine protease n=1 Tax=Testudinibacter sp. TR-2022 TaxID=2585029 RepID=UPI00111A722F|nr:rhomboid family intramembrane serine protease [Testudinibacter sp. TR-2022]TNH04591.1 rhomboid family intramembrane serine protease [Pasteurellaceae bacterium Phil31]TNH09395.1 rhomboid family intramembrane serine protease [Testudinibacter sp. TR-2022]TNH09818.1 rhomboid family intramembrane serine protease [Testudinibacter sp. TR-2022]TNH13863.1 rhomboid family intramembrane serine protease [Testudinibacter sp. TR-2022]TNH20668.1 rhomboid family intramembrane serine protease [Testudinibact